MWGHLAFRHVVPLIRPAFAGWVNSTQVARDPTTQDAQQMAEARNPLGASESCTQKTYLLPSYAMIGLVRLL